MLVNKNSLLFLTALLLLPASLPAGLISFTGQFDPSLATVTTGGGDGWFDPSGAPLSVTLWGSDSNVFEDGVMTQVIWTVVTGDPNVQFFWDYETFDDGPIYDRAGYILNGVPTQLSDSSGGSIQSGFVSGLSINPGDQFGFYVYSTDDCCGRAEITISGIPEPATVLLCGLGLTALGLLRRRRR